MYNPFKAMLTSSIEKGNKTAALASSVYFTEMTISYFEGGQ